MPAWLSPVVVAELLTAFVFGGMVFFAAAVAPMVFKRLPAEHAARFIRALFPVYYLVMAVAALAGALLLLGARPLDGLLLLATGLGFVAARQVLMPRANRLRDAELAGDAAAGRGFARVHQASVWLNGAQLIVVALVLVRLAAAGA
ncbi:MAG: DUF4149 domain-containing protein [Geminicoccaceae bacterium]|nr:DUF4149 domain-containing protein [Geminicoccaceae bacterium]